MARTNAGIQIAPGMNAQVTEDTITLVIDSSQDQGLSKSGKSRVVASTRGFVTLPNGQRLSLNLTAQPDDE